MSQNSNETTNEETGFPELNGLSSNAYVYKSIYAIFINSVPVVQC